MNAPITPLCVARNVTRIMPVALAMMALASAGQAYAAPKDVVVSRTASNVAAADGDALAVSVLVERADGTLQARSTDRVFRTGQRLRVKVIPSRTGRLSIYNTNPLGQTTLLWSRTVGYGVETVSPRMVLHGTSGRDRLHVVLEPQGKRVDARVWVEDALKGRGGIRKDISLDHDRFRDATLALNNVGNGVISTLDVYHKP